MIQQGAQLRHGDGDVSLERVRAIEVIEDAAGRAHLEGGTAHVTRSTEGVFTLFHVLEQRLGERRQDGVLILLSGLTHLEGDVVSHAETVLEEVDVQTQVGQVNIQGGLVVGEGEDRQLLVAIVDLLAQTQRVFVPVEDGAANARVLLDQFQQVGDVDRINNLETLALEGGLQLANGFFFKENAEVVEDGNDIHRNAPHVKGRSPSGMVSEERSEDKRGN